VGFYLAQYNYRESRQVVAGSKVAAQATSAKAA
jgi:hypothetical protein